MIILKAKKITGNFDKDTLLNLIMTHIIEPKLEKNKIIIIDEYPASMASLARRKGEISERFEFYINGIEIANGFHELNDPIEQRQRFLEQQEERQAEGEVTEFIDEDFLTALEYGMPPTGGLGVGIDRLVMLLTGQTSIREIILFPQLKAKP